MTKKKPKKPRYGLIPRANYKSVRDFIDFDYTDKLTPTEADWLDKFSKEFYGNTIAKDGTALHDTQEKKRELYRTTNQRNRDMWNQFERVNLDTQYQPDKDEDEK